MNKETAGVVIFMSVAMILTAIVNMSQTQRISELEDRVALIEGPAR